ncbi:hypothetical protein [Halocynthiibacter styelae]|uniref:Uncharacterized protein n=1 Tax=Halocynthiibacter styelae TaxID=2761955 RepID=A0A8J7LKZ1_9RHOB|nr:hypothetical protein [Paenihalocynthiibacter styelae]MBI1493614.1 hypothetical protein [Paenihalocynthiibacter styelae]
MALFDPSILKVALPSIATVLVALVVALTASQRERRQLHTSRHFEFADERAQLYANFVRQVGRTWDAWFTASNFSSDFKELPQVRLASEMALELDTQMNILRVRLPSTVVSACSQVNGMLQTYVAELELHDELYSVKSDQFEDAKERMLELMRKDVQLIESCRDRRSYLRKQDSL